MKKILCLIIGISIIAAGCKPVQQPTQTVDVEQVSASYSVFIAHPALPEARQKIWHKGTRRRVETIIDDQQTIALVNDDKQTLYVLSPDEQQGVAFKADYQFSNRYPSAWTILRDFFASNENIEVDGSEVIDDIVTTRYTATDSEGNPVRLWVWDEQEFPLKLEIDTPQGMAVTIWQDIDFETENADRIFEVPTGYDVIAVTL